MCLDKNFYVTHSLKNSPRTFWIYYKVVKITLSSPFYNYKWKPGYNKPRNDWVASPTQWIFYGGCIHVCRTFKEAQRLMNTFDIPVMIIRVKCYKKDLLGANTRQAAFKKVYLSKAEYSKNRH